MRLEKSNVTGYVLAGGQSKRMGRDKGLISDGKKTMVEYAVEVMEDLVSEVIIISNNKAYEQFGYQVIPDDIQGVGPIGGIYTGLSKANTVFSMFVACDTPLLHADLLRKMLIQPNGEVVVPKVDGKVEPMIGLYNKSAIPKILEKIEQQDYKMQLILDALQAEYILLPAHYTKQLLNINTPSDLDDWRDDY